MRLHSKDGGNNGEQQCIKHTQQAYDIAFDPKVENTQRAHRYTHVIPAKSSCEQRASIYAVCHCLSRRRCLITSQIKYVNFRALFYRFMLWIYIQRNINPILLPSTSVLAVIARCIKHDESLAY